MKPISALRTKTLALAGARGSFEEKLALAVFACALVLFSAQAVLAHEYKAGSLEIIHPWARATPHGAKVGGGYVEIKNEGGTADRLVSATADVAGKVEIHEMGMKDGIMTMRPLANGLEIPAHGTVALKPGSYHIMFMDLKGPISVDKPVSGTLTFEKAGTVKVEFKVEPVGAPGPASEMKGMDHSGMKH